MDLSARAFALYRKLTTLFSAERYHRTGESSIAQNGEGDVYDQSPYGLEDQMVSHSSVLFGTVSSNGLVFRLSFCFILLRRIPRSLLRG